MVFAPTKFVYPCRPSPNRAGRSLTVRPQYCCNHPCTAAADKAKAGSVRVGRRGHLYWGLVGSDHRIKCIDGPAVVGKPHVSTARSVQRAEAGVSARASPLMRSCLLAGHCVPPLTYRDCICLHASLLNAGQPLLPLYPSVCQLFPPRSAVPINTSMKSMSRETVCVCVCVCVCAYILGVCVCVCVCGGGGGGGGGWFQASHGL